MTDSQPIEETTVAPEPAPATYEDAAKAVWGEGATPAPAEAEKPAEAKPEAAEAPAEPEAPKQDERVAARIAVAKRAELRAAQERAELKAQRDALAKERADIEAKAARFKLLEEDPVKAFEELKLDPKAFLERLANEQDPTSIVAKKMAALEAEVTSLREERRKEIETAKERETRQAQEAAWSEASQTFVQFVEQTADKYPHLVNEFTEGEAVAEAEKILTEVVGYSDDGSPVTAVEAYFNQFGQYPDNDVIAEELDKRAKARVEARQKSVWRKQATAAPASQAISPGDPNRAAQTVNKGSSPRTLTPRAASEKASSSNGWSQEWADQESLRLLQGAIRD